MAILISQVSFEHHRSGLGIAETRPRISWRFEGQVNNWKQSACDIQIIRGVDIDPQIHSFNTSQSRYITWPGDPLEPAEEARVRVRAHGLTDQPSTDWSGWVSVETGLIQPKDWQSALPITSRQNLDKDKPKRPFYFRKAFDINTKTTQIQKARLYITALGLYEAEINGKRVGDHVLAPGFQSFKHRHVYDTYDVTEAVLEGRNAIGIMVGEGWYAGRLFGHIEKREFRNLYGDWIGAMCLLEVTFSDGTKVHIPTDKTWSSNFGPLSDSQIYNGETYDSREESAIQGWSTPSFDGGDWLGVEELPPLTAALVPSDGPPVRKLKEVQPKKIFQTVSGKVVVDFGQNFAGWVRIVASGPSGTNIILRHAEVLENGEIGTRPLRTADPTDHFILNGTGQQVWEPRFTFHGFRYVQIDNWPTKDTPLEPKAITGIAVWSDMERTGWFKCSNELLNQLHSNVVWSMRSNFIHVPTDCPQRDERMGWIGDAHIFGPTANFLYDPAGFWRSWHKDVWSEMQTATKHMAVPSWVPFTAAKDTYIASTENRTAIWGDVTVGNPFNAWRAFGDKGLLEEQYAQGKAWLDVGVLRGDDGLWDRSGYQYGDWLDPEAPPDDPGDAKTNRHLVADTYLVQMTKLLAEIGDTIGDNEGAEKYRAQHEKLIDTFRAKWMKNGRMVDETQTAYVLGLAFDVFEESDSEAAAQTLRKLVKGNDYLVGTGFAATALLGHAMCKIGAADDFYKMLLQPRVPSWLYQVTMGGTTTWERWDSMLQDGSINPGEMTSFNHYAFGSVADWIHQFIGGLAPGSPGWEEITVSPTPGGITSAEARFLSGYGEIKTSWNIEDTGFHLQLTVPPNSCAVVTMPWSGRVVKVRAGVHEFHDEK